MGFDAAHAVEPLDYDFTKYVPDAQGTIAEPTDAVLRKFQAAMLKHSSDLGVNPAEMADRRTMVAVLGKVDEKKLAKLDGQIATALANLCQGTPSREQIAALPPRLRLSFMNWLMVSLFGDGQDPTSLIGNADTRRSPVMSNGVATAG